MSEVTYRVEKLHGRPIVDGSDVRRLRIGADPNRSRLRGDAMFPTVVRDSRLGACARSGTSGCELLSLLCVASRDEYSYGVVRSGGFGGLDAF